MQQRSDLETPRPGKAMILVFIGLGLLGLFALWSAGRFYLDPSEEPKAFVGPLLIGAVLTGFGLIMPFVLLRAGRRDAFRAEAQQRRAGEPWLWREDWASGRITGAAPTAARMLWLFALVWNGFTWPVAWLFLSEPGPEAAVYFILVFPAAGLIIILLAVHGSLQARKYGSSVFVLKTNPGVIGRTIEGEIETRMPTAPADRFEVRLQCSRRYTTGHGKNRRTHRQSVWKDHVTLPASDLTQGPAGLRVPVVFGIPTTVPATSDTDPAEGIEWHLIVDAKTPGVDYSDSFEVPVFATGTSPLTAGERDALMAGRRAHAALFVPDAPVMRVTPSAAGGMDFSFKPKVKVRDAAGAVVMTVLTCGATWYLVQRGIPIAPFFVGFFALLFAVGTLFALFHSSRVTVTDGVVVIRHRVLGVGTTRRFAPGEIVEVRSEVVGEGNAQSFEVKVFTRAGTSFSAGAMMPTQVEADWSAEQLRAAIVRGAGARVS